MFDLGEEVECGIGGEWITNAVCVRDNVAVITNIKTNEQFWLLLVDKMVHVVHESFEDRWGNSYVKGDVVLKGQWYEKL
jgi:hypothetical protein